MLYPIRFKRLMWVTLLLSFSDYTSLISHYVLFLLERDNIYICNRPAEETRRPKDISFGLRESEMQSHTHMHAHVVAGCDVVEETLVC